MKFGALFSMFGKYNPRGVPAHFFFGAQRMDYSTAERADVTRQNYTVCPRHWYIDAVFICRECKKEFVFSAKEQRFWYEEKSFYVDSIPRRCAECRKDERTKLELRKRYDAQISMALGKCPPDAKKAVVEIIDQLEATEGEIPQQMRQNRSALQRQLANAS